MIGHAAVKMVRCIKSDHVRPFGRAEVVDGRIYTVAEECDAVDPSGTPVACYELMEPSASYICKCCGKKGVWPMELFRDLDQIDPPLVGVRRKEDA